MMKIKYLLIAVALLTLLIPTTVFAAGGFDEFGWNYNANIFNGLADGTDGIVDGKVWGVESIYANDKLVMKWNEKWDECFAAGADNEAVCAGAWIINEYNGMFPGGTGERWSYKIIWVGSTLQNSPYWAEGGSAYWNYFEIIMSHGIYDGAHLWETHATPAGLGN